MHGEAKEWLDAFFFDSYLYVQSKWSHPWSPHAGLLYCSFVFDRIATFTTIVRPHLLRTPLYTHASMQETVMRMRSVLKLAFLSVTYIHTYIHTDANEMRSRISCLALRRSAMILYTLQESLLHTFTKYCPKLRLMALPLIYGYTLYLLPTKTYPSSPPRTNSKRITV